MLNKTYEQAVSDTFPLTNTETIQKNKEQRLNVYNQMPEFFADVNGIQYGLLQMQTFPQSYYDEVRNAVSRCNHIYQRVYDLMMRGSLKDFLNLGFTEEFFDFVKVQNLSTLTLLGRYDFAVVQNETTGIPSVKVIEFNADTPLLLMEAFKVNTMMANHYNVANPNKDAAHQLAKGINDSIQSTIDFLELKSEPHIVFACSKGANVPDEYDDSLECRRSTEYLQSLCDYPSDFRFMEDLVVVEEDGYIGDTFVTRGLYTSELKQIDILYRHTYPAEFFPEDIAEDGTVVGHVLMELVVEKKVGLINPPTAFAIQSKAILGLIWGLMENKLWFTEQECEWIQQYFLPTYLGNEPFILENKAYVEKSTFGRNGDTIKIYNNLDDLYYSSIQNSYTQYEEIFQEYTQLPEVTILTDKEAKNAKYIVGAFTVLGEPSAIAFRVGNEIIDDACYYLPCGIE